MKQGNLQDFIQYLQEQVDNHSIYVWGAQGQHSPTITENWIRRREQNTGGMKVNGKYMTYADIAVSEWKKKCEEGYTDILHAYDCSGLLCYYLQNLHGLIPSDSTANNLMKTYTDMQESEPKQGYWVFRVDANGKGTHVGVLVSDSEVVHAKGRLYGVVKEAYKESYWHHCYKPKMFSFDEPSPTPQPTSSKYVHPLGSVRVREGNGTQYKQIKPTANKTNYLPYLGQDAESPYWYLVEWQGQQGYITSKARYTEVVDK